MESVTAERLAELKQLAEEIRDNTVCPSSRAAYVIYELKQFFKGIKRELAVTQARGVGNVKVGKDPLSFELFEFLSSHLMALSGSDSIFPPHVAILGKMKAVQDMGVSTIQKLDDVRREIVNDIVRELEERAIGAKTVTFEGLHDALRSYLREAGIQNQINTNNPSESHHGIEANTAEEITPLPTFFWAGRFRRVPPGFAFPECSVAHLWVLWRCGHAEIKPLHLLEGADMPNRDNQKRLSDIRYPMKKIEAIAAERNLLSSSQTVEEAIHVYTACASSVEVPSTTASARKRRRGQLAWTSIVRLHRIADKNTRSNTRL